MDLGSLRQLHPLNNMHNEKYYKDKNVHFFAGQAQGEIRLDKLDKEEIINQDVVHKFSIESPDFKNHVFVQNQGGYDTVNKRGYRSLSYRESFQPFFPPDLNLKENPYDVIKHPK